MLNLFIQKFAGLWFAGVQPIMVDEQSLMLQPILPARWTDFSQYPVTKFVTEWSFVQRGSVFATSAAMHTLSGHVTARLGWRFAV